MYRLQHLNIIVSTDDDKKKAAYQAMGYQLLADTPEPAPAAVSTPAATPVPTSAAAPKAKTTKK